MINSDTIIKFLRRRGYCDWPERVKIFNNSLDYIKLGFPGIRNNHLSLTSLDFIEEGDIFIYSENMLIEGENSTTNAPLMLQFLGENQYLIQGIGLGRDIERDPNLDKIRWLDTIELLINKEHLLLSVDVRPTDNGGPGYYYFFRSFRDFRY